MAKSTRTTYRRGVTCFDSFRTDLGLSRDWPAPVKHVVAFIAHLSTEGKASSTICTYTSSLSYIHKLHDWSDPTANFIIQKLKEGSRRQGKSADSRRPISLQILRQLCLLLPGICRSSFEVCLFKAAFLLAFFGFLRVGEFSVTSQEGEVGHVLSIRDVLVKTGQYMEVTIRTSKTDQRGESATLRFLYGMDPVLCPVVAMSNFLRMRPVRAGPLFIHFGGGPMTRYQFESILKKGITLMGLPPTNFSSHSFRIGAATSAAIRGIPIDMIKNRGRWRSSAVNLYIRPHRLLPL